MKGLKEWLSGALVASPVGRMVARALFAAAVLAAATALVDAGLLGGELLDALRVALATS